jgi:hypothetical protein
VDLNRIDISLHGISAEVANAAIAGLDASLSHRLQGLAWSGRALSLADTQAEVNLDATRVKPGATAADIRALLVEQIATAISQQLAQETSL